MVLKNLPKSQSEWFYDNNWTKEMESKLIDKIQWLQAASVWDVGGNNEEAGEWLCEKVNAAIGKDYTDAFYTGKISFLKERFNIFDVIRKRPYFTWNQSTNEVQSAPAIWHQLVEEFGRPWIRAYENVGEPIFDTLKELFEYKPPNIPIQWSTSEDDTDTEDPYNSWDGRDV